jgi:hypothetical protein
MRNILIPTDFNPSALPCISELCRQTETSEVQLIFVHLFRISDSISDLLMLSRRNREYEHVSDEFYQKCADIKATFSHVKSIKIEFFYGSTRRVFRNYLEMHLVDAVFDLRHCSLKPLNSLSVDPTMLIERCGLEVIKLIPQSKISTKQYVTEELLTGAV